MLRHLLLTALLFTLVAADDKGCVSEDSSVVKQDRVHTAYWLYYDTNADVTYARAQFRLGNAVGTTLILQAPAKVEFDGRPMPFNALLDWHEAVIPGRTEGGTFVYSDVDGNTFTNEAPAYAEVSLPALPATVPQDRAFELTWVGAPVQDGELFETVVAAANNGFDFIRVDQRNVGATSVVLPANQLEQVAPGPAKLALRRHRDHALDEHPGAGGKLITTFQPRDGDFVLE